MGYRRAPTASGTAQAQGWKTARPEPVGARRHRLGLEERHPVADPVADAPEEVRLQRRHLLAAAAGLAEGGRVAAPVEAAAAGDARQAREIRSHRLVSGVVWLAGRLPAQQLAIAPTASSGTSRHGEAVTGCHSEQRLSAGHIGGGFRGPRSQGTRSKVYRSASQRIS
jgi:hypothetical protein